MTHFFCGFCCGYGPSTPLGLIRRLSGSRHAGMFVESASRLQRLDDEHDKNTTAILAVVKRFVPDIGVLRAFQTGNGTEYSNSMLVDFCTGLGTSRVCGTVYAAAEWSRRGHHIASRQGWTRGATRGSAAVSGYQSGRGSGVEPMPHERALGWSLYFGNRSVLAGRQHL